MNFKRLLNWELFLFFVCFHPFLQGLFCHHVEVKLKSACLRAHLKSKAQKPSLMKATQPFTEVKLNVSRLPTLLTALRKDCLIIEQGEDRCFPSSKEYLGVLINVRDTVCLKSC